VREVPLDHDRDAFKICHPGAWVVRGASLAGGGERAEEIEQGAQHGGLRYASLPARHANSGNEPNAVGQDVIGHTHNGECGESQTSPEYQFSIGA
jgi:hypothetical protein